MTYEQEVVKKTDRLFASVVAQSIKDLIDKDPEIRREAEEFFEEDNKIIFPSESATRFYETAKRILLKAKAEGNIEEKIRKFKKYTVIGDDKDAND